MEQSEVMEQSANRLGDLNDSSATQSPPGTANGAMLTPQVVGQSCGCAGAAGASLNETGMAAANYIFAIGRIEMRYPSLAVEKEFAQATGRADTAGLTDREAAQAILSERQNRYLVRQLCWVLTIEGLETYILVPRNPSDYDLLLEAVRANPSPLDIDVVIGSLGPIAPVDMCNGLLVPIVIFDQIYSFDRDALVKAIPRPEAVAAKQEKQFRSAAGELFDRMMQLADNSGATDEHRALNYLAVRYPAIYATVTDANARNYSLTAVEVQPSRLSGVRKIVDVVFSFTNRQTDVGEKYFVRVDVTEEFPFLVTKMSQYYDR
jgi:hypothetical protein